MVSWTGLRTPANLQPPDGGRYDHAVQFHESETALVENLTRFLRQGLTAGEPCIIVVAGEHRKALVRRLEADRLKAADLERMNKLRLVDARELLSAITVAGRFDKARFHAAADSILASLRPAGDDVAIRAGGEAVDVLWREGRHDAAMELEALWHEYAAARGVTLLCTYALASFSDARGLDIGDVCAVHTHVLSAR